MDKFRIDLDGIAEKLNAKKMYKLADVQDKIEKIGCGLVRFPDESNKMSLWKIMKDKNDGTEYIAAMYEDEEKDIVSTSWSVETDRLVKTATIFYKNTPVTSIVFAEIGIPETEVRSFLENLPERLANNKEVVQSMLKSIDGNYRKNLLKQYPEIVR